MSSPETNTQETCSFFDAVDLAMLESASAVQHFSDYSERAVDEASHERDDRKERDAFVNSVMDKVGLPILHVKARKDYDPKTLAEDINRTMATITPDHDAVMVKCHKTRGRNTNDVY